MVGLNEGDEIGVDVEVSRPISDAMELASAHFTQNEQAQLRSAGNSCTELSRAFLKVWVRKEAAVKAYGCGLSIPLNGVECSGSDREITVRLSDGQCCKTGIVQFRGDPILAWARRVNTD